VLAVPWPGSVGLDLSSIRRRLLRRPSDFLIPAATLAIVIGVWASVFAVVDGTMLRPLPFPEQDRLVRVFTMPPGATESRSRNPLASIDFVRFLERTRTLDRFEVIWQRERSLVGAGDPVIVKAGSVSAGFFDLLGGRAILGRTFTPAEDEPGSALAVLGYGLWQRMFGGDQSVVGRRLSIDGEPHVIIGVMAPEFQPAYRESELWTPLGVNAHNMPTPNATYLVSVGRLAQGRSLSDARREFTQLMEDVGHEAANRRGWTAGMVTLREYQFGDRRGALLVVAAMAALLLLLAASNVTSVTLARTIARKEEFAIRASVGAGRRDLFRLICLETIVVYGIAAIGGLLIAVVGLPTILSLDPEMARALGRTTLDWRVGNVAFLVAGVLGCISGVWPAVKALYGPDLRGGGSGARTTPSRRARRFQEILVGIQTALALTVLVVGGSLLEAFWRLSRIDPGFEAGGVLTAQVRLSSGYATHEQRIAFMDRLLESIRRIPGVTAASSVSTPFIPGFTYTTAFEVENQPTADGQLHPGNFRRVAPGYLTTLHIPVLRGRDLLWSDRRTSPWVALVSQSLAERVWPHQDPIGHRIRRREPGTDWMTVVGIVGDVKDVSLAEGPDPTLYVSQEQHLPTTLPIALVVRTQASNVSATAREIRTSMATLDKGQVVDRFLPMTSYLDASLSADRFRTALVAVFGATGLMLVLVGLAGLTARTVTERAKEVGVRLALGAAPSRLWWMTTCDALKGVVAGLSAGILLALVALRSIGTTLVGIAAPSIGVWGAEVALIVALCALAAGAPAHRVTRIGPMVVLRRE
jgi:putative ABC transport system permease protein